MLTDGRSNTLVLVAHCILNTNAIAVGPKTPSVWPAMVDEVVSWFMRNRASIVQLPCPEQHFFGFVRESATKTDMESPGYRELCRKLASEAVELAAGYVRSGFRVLGFVGRSSSPSCGVRRVWVKRNGKPVEAEGMGIFFEELRRELDSRGLKLPLVDLERTEVERCLSELDGLLRGLRPSEP